MLHLDQLWQTVKGHLGQLEENNVEESKWVVEESPVAGRGVIAAEDIGPGEVIFVDHPLIYGPRSGALCRRGCTVCRKIGGADSLKCPKCSLLVCSEECQSSETHLNDCSVISSWKLLVPTEEVDENVMIKALTPIRALLLEPQGKLFLSSLQAHVTAQHGAKVEPLKNYFEVSKEDEEFMTLACSVLDANAFEIASPYGKDEMSIRGLYPVAALMNHSCVPNTRHSFDKHNNMVVKAVKLISAGSEVFTCYSGQLWGTAARRHHLYKTKHFLCNCERCADPTEYGTNLAALKCFSRNCRGILLPLSPLNTISSWCCNECDITVPSKHIGAVQSALGSLMGTLDFDNPVQLEEFVTTRLLKYIPQSNQIYFEIQCRLIWLFGATPKHRWSELPETRLALKEALCRRALRTLAVLAAGDVHLRGLLLYHLHAALAERARRTPDLYEELKPEIESTIEQANDILDGDVSAPPDLQLRRNYLGYGCDKPTQERLLMLNI